MKKELTCLLWICAFSLTTQAIIIDDLEDGSLSEYTKSVMLEQSGINALTFSVTSGKLQISKPAGDNSAEQVLLVRDDCNLKVGQYLRVDASVAGISSLYADFGIAVSKLLDPVDAVWTSGTADARRDYLYMYIKGGSTGWGCLGFNGTTQVPNSGYVTNQNLSAVTGIFIHRTADTVFEVGYTTAAGDTVFRTLTVASLSGTYNAIGFYGDIRNEVTYGYFDNLRIWDPVWAAHSPTPASGNLSAGTPLGDGTVNVTLDWQAGLDPSNEAQVNPAITKHYVFLSDTPTDPNLYYLGTVTQPQPDTDPATSYGTVTGLSEVTAYRWAVVEALAGYDQQSFTPGVSILSAVDPNNLIGPTWTFTTAVGVDRRLVGEYLFENNLNDNTPQGNNGSAAEPNAPTFSNATPLSAGSGSYAVFDGGDFVNFGTAAYPKAGTFIYGVGGGLEEGTITCWVKATKAGGLLTNYNDGLTSGFALSLAANGTQIDARMNARGESGDVGTVQGRPGKTDFHFVTDGQWHMVAATWKWGDTMRVYVDGGEVTSVAAGTPTEFADWQYGVLLGASRNGTNRNVLQDFFGGAVDTLRIYNYVRTPEQVANEYYATTGNKACTDPSFTGSAFNFDNSGQSYCKVDVADFVVFAENWLLNGLSTGE